MKNKLDLALLQYTTIDKHKCDALPNVLAGFYCKVNNDLLCIVPFLCLTLEDKNKLKEEIDLVQDTVYNISFVQHYITYELS